MTRPAGASLALAWTLVHAALIAAQAPREVLPGDPLPGLTPREFEEFTVGREDFSEVEETEEGLGPAFNGAGCAVCHSIPAIGGANPIGEIRAGVRDPDGTFRELSGGTLFHLFSIPDHRCQPQIPPEANVIARRVGIPLFGAGLVEAIPDETLLALEDPDDRDRDGVSGRAALLVDVASGERRVGRFGWKAQHATLLAFSGDAYTNEMGITNDLFPRETALGIDPERMRVCDPHPDPEDRRDPRTGRRAIDNFEAFMRFLAPVTRGPIDEEVRAGERVFSEIGCATCHVPVLVTGPDPRPPFHRQPVALFSDLLLHDVGTGDGIVQAAAAADEIRTPALWGLRFRRPLLHDGSAPTPEAAILRHTHEGEAARRAYERLSEESRRALGAFLRSL
jgi:CxxC motif-containing protein (DUF1111 family)